MYAKPRASMECNILQQNEWFQYRMLQLMVCGTGNKKIIINLNNIVKSITQFSPVVPHPHINPP